MYYALFFLGTSKYLINNDPHSIKGWLHQKNTMATKDAKVHIG